MVDWQGVVSERLGALEDERQREEIVRELAGHLEDFYLEKCARGLSEAAAMELALEQVGDWHALAQKIRVAKREEGIVNYRTKSFWLPGLVAFTVSMVWLMILQLAIPIGLPWYPTDHLARRAAFTPARDIKHWIADLFLGGTVFVVARYAACVWSFGRVLVAAWWWREARTAGRGSFPRAHVPLCVELCYRDRVFCGAQSIRAGTSCILCDDSGSLGGCPGGRAVSRGLAVFARTEGAGGLIPRLDFRRWLYSLRV